MFWHMARVSSIGFGGCFLVFHIWTVNSRLDSHKGKSALLQLCPGTGCLQPQDQALAHGKGGQKWFFLFFFGFPHLGWKFQAGFSQRKICVAATVPWHRLSAAPSSGSGPWPCWPEVALLFFFCFCTSVVSISGCTLTSDTLLCSRHALDLSAS